MAETPPAAVAEIKTVQGQGCTGYSGISGTVAAHYNKLEEQGRAFRKESRIYYMRNFNNWTKSMLIQDYVDRIKKSRPDLDFRQNHGHRDDRRRHDHHRDRERERPRPEFKVLDIACGKGGDLLKWQKAGVTHITGVDIADISVKQAQDRYMDMRHKNRGRVFSADFFAADCTRKRLKDMYRRAVTMFDIVSCQFAFHYCFESEEQAECMIRNAAECLKPGGFFIGTTPDAEAILNRLKDGQRSFGNSVYSVEFDEDSPVIKDRNNLPKFGNKYNFHLEGVVDCPEFLVNFGAFCDIADKHGLMLIHQQKFENFFKEKRMTESGNQLLYRIKALEQYPPYPNVDLVAGEDSYGPAKKYIARFEGSEEGDLNEAGEPVYASERDKHRKPLRVQTMSQEEWEAVSIYQVFAFKKI